MIKIENIIQLKAFARQDGALLSLLWIAGFACLIYIPQYPFGNLLTLSTPFFIGWRLIKFRNYALDGIISFRRGMAYSIYTFFYASAIFAIAQYLYFRFLDNGTFLAMLTEATNTLSAIYKENGLQTESLKNDMTQLSSLTPVELVFIFMIQNLLIGSILSLPIAAICTRRGKKTITINKNQKQ